MDEQTLPDLPERQLWCAVVANFLNLGGTRRGIESLAA